MANNSVAPSCLRAMFGAIEAVINRYYPNPKEKTLIPTPHQEGEGTVHEFHPFDLLECWHRLFGGILLGLVLAVSLSGCGAAVSPSTVHAQPPIVTPPTTPDSQSCGVTADGDGEACSFFHNIVDTNGNALGYCQGESHYFPLTKTYSFSLEIGINELISDPNLSGCNVPIPERMTLLNIRGANSLIPFTNNQTTIVDWIYGVDAGHKASLFNGTLTAMHGNPIATALQGDGGENLVFASGHAADSLLVWFNLDLPGSAPATIKVCGSGDTE